MRIRPIGSALLAASLALSACGTGNDDPKEPVTLEQAQWTKGTARQLRDTLAKRAEHGLDRMKFADEDTLTTRDEAALTQAALAYAGALARGASDPDKLFDIYTLPRPEPDLRRGLAEALRTKKVDEWLESLAPQDADYRRLSQAYMALREAAPGSAAIPDVGKALEPGAADPRVPAIARQLAALGYLDKPAGAQRYTPALAGAVRRMQADYGIEPDGIVGGDTLAILNLSDAERARAIAVDMERRRWLERNPPATRIDVNIAAARLSYWRDGKLADTRRVVVGETDKETPQLGSPIFRLVANPSWTVPRSIEEKEIAPKGAGYLARNNMVRKDGMIVQLPGPTNSLGQVKFDMQNDHAIYLHDTPAKALFGEVQRQRSHGCVRVEDALGFARIIAADEGVLDRWEDAVATGEETFVPLPRKIPVRLLYLTVLFDDQGEPVVRDDPYGWNDRIATALGFDTRALRRVRASGGDLGP